MNEFRSLDLTILAASSAEIALPRVARRLLQIAGPSSTSSGPPNHHIVPERTLRSSPQGRGRDCDQQEQPTKVRCVSHRRTAQGLSHCPRCHRTSTRHASMCLVRWRASPLTAAYGRHSSSGDRIVWIRARERISLGPPTPLASRKESSANCTRGRLPHT
jgi:hypothetical protein